VFFEKDGKLFTPPAGNILPGITRATVLENLHELDIPVERKIIHHGGASRPTRLFSAHRSRSHRLVH